MRECPLCGCTLKEMPLEGVAGCFWSTEKARRFDCPEGHTFLIVDTALLARQDALRESRLY